MSYKWTFTDFVTTQVYTFEINPNAGGSPLYSKNVLHKTTSAVDGHTLMFEGRDQPPSLDFTGTLLSQAQYNAFVTWYQKRRQILLVDDLGRSFWIYVVGFEPKRERSIQYPWKHSFTVKSFILENQGSPYSFA